MIKFKSALLYIFITFCGILMFASFDAESYFDYSAVMDLSDEKMYIALTDNTEGLLIAEEEPEQEEEPEERTEYVLNDESAEIKEYKFILYYLDYLDYPEDSRFDSVLEDALETYQTEKLLNVSGILDEATMTALDDEVLIYKIGKYGETILDYKEMMQQLGYFDSDDTLTDAFDEDMEDAVEKYQKNNKLEVNGQLDIDTQIMLRKPLENQVDADGNAANPDDDKQSTNSTSDNSTENTKKSSGTQTTSPSDKSDNSSGSYIPEKDT